MSSKTVSGMKFSRKAGVGFQNSVGKLFEPINANLVLICILDKFSKGAGVKYHAPDFLVKFTGVSGKKGL